LDKNTFFNATYTNDFKPTETSKMVFIAYATDRSTGPKKAFDMSHLNAVLLPHSDRPYTILIGALGSNDIPYKTVKSNAYSLMAGLGAILLVLSQVFVF
jgi:hypothetical protein